MKAGRELDASVAEKVMRWKLNKTFCPSTYIGDAWKVVEKLKKDNIYIDIYSLPLNGYRVEVSTHDGEQYVHMSTVGADTAQLAICLAALKAVGVEVDC